jgi:hypothetical protein
VSPKASADDTSLKRLPGQGWQTRDGRFTIETASGTWSLLDAEQTDDLGLPLVRGPFRSLAEAKAAIDEARSSQPVTSTLADRAATAKRPAAKPAQRNDAPPKAQARKQAEAAEPAEPRWIAELDAADRRRAHRLIAALAKRDIRDAEGIVRRDLAGDVASVARVALAEHVAALLDDADADAATTKVAARLIAALVEGRDDDLDVRWRLVDGDNRPITLSSDDVTAGRDRRSARH